ncbi:MAG: 23S rRNA (uracil1939-C5)-methyltransferase, partial [Alteromonadaceae bacterium]
HDSQLKLKQSALGGLFKRFANIDSLPWQDSLTAHPWHYRRVARVGVWYDTKSQQFNVGFRQRNSKFITPINECEVLVEAFANLFSAFTELLPQLKVGRSVTHLEVCQADNANVVVIRHTQPLSKADVVKINQLAQVNDYLLVSEYEKGQFTCLSQAVMPTLYYRLPGFSSGGGLDGQGQGLELTFRVDDFIQVNGQINQQMIKQAIDWLALSKSDHVLDLFCGIGNFSLPLATLCATVTGIEGVDGMVRQASHNARHNQLDNCTFLQADLAAPGRLHTGDQTHFNKILLDPARAGAEQVMASIKPFKAQSIVYVSCEPLTLARDSAVLLKSGYQLTKIALMDMFSQTRHVEVMALFEKSPVKTANKPH